MRQTAIMDILSDGRGQDGGWAPTSERVLRSAELGGEVETAEPVLAVAAASLTHVQAAPIDPDSLPSVPSFDRYSARPSQYSSTESPAPAAPATPSAAAPTASTPAPSTGPVPLTAEDLDALEDLTYSELARARGVDPDAVERLSGVKLGRPPAHPAPAPAPAAVSARVTPHPPARALVAAPPPPAVPAPQALPTWPPAGHDAASTFHRQHQPWPHSGRSRRPARRTLAALALVALAGAAAWYFLLRPAGPPTPSAWDPRVASTAAFVADEQGLPWKHPVRVVFLSGSSYEQRFGESLASAQSQPGPAGTDVADYVASGPVVYVSGTNLDYYSRFALTGQLTEALRDQYLGTAPSAVTRSVAARAQFVYLGELSPEQLRALHAEQGQHG